MLLANVWFILKLKYWGVVKIVLFPTNSNKFNKSSKVGGTHPLGQSSVNLETLLEIGNCVSIHKPPSYAYNLLYILPAISSTFGDKDGRNVKVLELEKGVTDEMHSFVKDGIEK